MREVNKGKDGSARTFVEDEVLEGVAEDLFDDIGAEVGEAHALFLGLAE